ncbi:hypothetical protein DDQ68_00940 [Hymenobacter nivis]|uniref:Uncharacterized protein n=1 Tax=Hymenobacter nivis TaxID=1850093 RepID=A0A2Z3GK19_9BACT|nr:hypothetical protein DDQ68_00940 [Hymenobacter nivis]
MGISPGTTGALTAPQRPRRLGSVHLLLAVARFGEGYLWQRFRRLYLCQMWQLRLMQGWVERW